MAVAVSLKTDSLLNALKPTFINGVEDLRANEVFFYNSLEEFQGGTLEGDTLKFAVNTQRAASFRPLPIHDASYPPAPDLTTYTGEITAARHGGTISVDDYAELKTMSDVGAFTRASALAAESFYKDMKEVLEFEALNNGSGVMNPYGGIGNVSSVTSDNWTFDVSIFDEPKFAPGRQILFMTLTSQTSTVFGCACTSLNSSTWRDATYRDYPTQGYYTIKSVQRLPGTSPGIVRVTIKERSPGTNSPASPAGAYANVTPGSTSTNLDFAIIADSIAENTSASTTNLTRQMMGVDGIVNGPNGLSAGVGSWGYESGQAWVQQEKQGTSLSDSTFQALSPSTVGEWAANVMDATSYGSTLTTSMLSRAMTYHNVFGVTGTNQWARWIAHPMQLNEYALTLESKERYCITANTPSSLPAGRASLNQRNGQGEALAYAGIPMYGNKFCRVDRVYALNSMCARKKTLKPFNFNPAHPNYSNRIVTEMNGHCAEQILALNRLHGLAIHNLAIPTAL